MTISPWVRREHLVMYISNRRHASPWRLLPEEAYGLPLYPVACASRVFFRSSYPALIETPVHPVRPEAVVPFYLASRANISESLLRTAT